MKPSEIVHVVMFDYGEMTRDAIVAACAELPKKQLRWLGAHHPDNATRRLFFEMTGVAIGKDTVLNSNLVVSDGYASLLRIGDRVAISPNVTMVCESAPNHSRLAAVPYVRDRLVCRRPIAIEDDAWIGAGAVILPGVTVGRGAIVGAGAVVCDDVPAGTIVAGVPARVIRRLEEAVPPA